MKILISGFQAFAGDDVNPTQGLIEKILKGESKFPSHLVVRGVVLPVLYSQAFAQLKACAQEFDPNVIVALGQANGRSADIEIERVAINCQASEIADNSGEVRDQAVDPLGPPAYFSTLPIDRLLNSLKSCGVRASISNSAGTYVCNSLFYQLQDWTLRSTRKSGFIHVPLLPEQALRRGPAVPSMELAEMTRALGEVITCLGSRTVWELT